MTQEPAQAMATEERNGSANQRQDSSLQRVDVPDKQGWRKLLAYLGPGFLVCIAYIDPGNFESDLQAGARFKYELLWVLLLASVGGLLIQSLSANLGVVTGQHLAQHCRAEYPPNLNFALWMVAELAIVASDIPEVIGTAFALNMLFGLEIWVGVLITGFSTLLFLALQQYGVRKLEGFISALVFIIAFCFMTETFFANPKPVEVLEGLFVPQLSGTGATGLAISLLGAVVMPHNLFLHSALVLSRKAPRTDRAIKDGCRYNLIEVSIALAIAFSINISVIAVSGSVCSRTDLSPSDRANCDNLDLNRAPFLLKNTLGGAASKMFAVALLASGQSSTITGTYAGQYVMQGFLELQYKPWVRNLVTRMVAILPSLAVALIAGARGAGELIIISSMILAFELPFALLPLLKFTSSPLKMGPYVSHPLVTILIWALGLLIVAVNVYYLCDIIVNWLLQSELILIGRVAIGILTLTANLMYVGAILFLAFRKDTESTFSPPYDQAGDNSSSDSDIESPSRSPLSSPLHKTQQELKIISKTNLLPSDHQDSAIPNRENRENGENRENYEHSQERS